MNPIRAVWEAGRRVPWLGALGLLGAVAAAAMPVYLWFSHYRYIVSGEAPFVWDFSYYYEAAGRFAAHPLTLYADPEFFYPPPSVLMLLPWRVLPLPAAYLLSQFAIAAAVVVGLVLALKAWEGDHAERLPGGTKALLVLTGLGTAPVFQTLKYGQVGPLLMLIGMGAVLLVQRERPFTAALALAGGFWLKLYPLVLVPLGLRTRHQRFLAGLVVGLIVGPALLLGIVPLELYASYFFEHLPAQSDITSMHALNESLVGVAVRLNHSLAVFHLHKTVVLEPGARAAGLAVALLGFGGLLGAWLRRRLATATTGAGLLALVPVVSPLGWEHLYTLALPLLLFALLAARSATPWARVLVVLGAVVFFVPTLPTTLMVASFEWWPRPVHDLIYARHLLATLGLLGFVVAREAGTETQRAPAG